MGDPRKLKNKYETPRKIWDAERIRAEKKLGGTYGLKNTREVWIALQDLKRARRGAMKYLSYGDAGATMGLPLMKRLARLGIIGADAKLDDILALKVEDFLERRLQTRVLKRGLASTARQARQLITHGFISVKGRKVSIPSYMVSVDEDGTIAYYKPIDISIAKEERGGEGAAPAGKEENAHGEAGAAAAEPKAE